MFSKSVIALLLLYGFFKEKNDAEFQRCCHKYLRGRPKAGLMCVFLRNWYISKKIRSSCGQIITLRAKCEKNGSTYKGWFSHAVTSIRSRASKLGRRSIIFRLLDGKCGGLSCASTNVYTCSTATYGQVGFVSTRNEYVKTFNGLLSIYCIIFMHVWNNGYQDAMMMIESSKTKKHAELNSIIVFAKGGHPRLGFRSPIFIHQPIVWTGLLKRALMDD